MALNHSPDRFVYLPFRLSTKDVPDWMLCWRYATMHNPSSANSAIEDVFKSMNTYRTQIVKTCTLAESKHTPNDNFIEHTLKRYCEFVGMAQAHFPLSDGTVDKSMHYIWTDSFHESSKYDTLNSNSELISCIYNLAASHNYCAVTAAQTGSVEGIKTAFKDFQNAAGYYEMVESLVERLPADQLTKGDMKRDSLTFLIRICLAQTHHCGYLKAEESMQGNHDMLSKIAMEAAKQYDEVHALMMATPWYTSKAENYKDVEVQLRTAAAIFRSRAHLHLALRNQADMEMGVALGYYERVKESLAAIPSQRTPSMTTWVNSVVTSVNVAHDKAIKENNTVHHSRIMKDVPDPAALPRSLGQPTKHRSFVEFESKRGEDPFFGIVPTHIAKMSLRWREQQRKNAKVAESAASTCRRNTTDKLQCLGVSAAIQTMSGEVQSRGRVPEPLRGNILKLRVDDKTGEPISITAKLKELITTCDLLYQVTQSKLKEVEEELAKEQAKDATYVEAYGEKMWRALVPGSTSTPDFVSLTTAIQDHNSGLQQWLVTPFSAARKSLQDYGTDIARLDWSIEDLDALMPFVESKEARQQSGKVMELVEQLKTLTKKKTTIEEEQNTAQKAVQDLLESDNVVFALSAVDAAQRDDVLAKYTKEVVDAIEKVNVKTREENALVAEADAIMTRLGELQSVDPIGSEIQKICNRLENSVSMYTELHTELSNIAAYAAKEVDSFDNTLGLAKSFRVSRQLEAEEVQGRLDAQIAAKMSEMQIQQQQQAPQASYTSLPSQSLPLPPSPPQMPPSSQQQQGQSYMYDRPPVYESEVRPPTYEEMQRYQQYQQQPTAYGAAAYSSQPPPPQQQIAQQGYGAYAAPPPPPSQPYVYPPQPQQPGQGGYGTQPSYQPPPF